METYTMIYFNVKFCTIQCILFIYVIFVTCSKMRVTDLKACSNKTHYPWLITSSDVFINGHQEFDWNVTLDEPVGNDNKVTISIDRILGTRALPLFKINENGLCNALLKIGGDLFLDIAKALNVKHPKKCPIEQGFYHFTAYKVNYDGFPMAKMIPKGVYKATFLIVDKTAKKKVMICMQAIMENPI